MRRATLLGLALLLLPSICRAQEAPKPSDSSRIAAGFWVDGKGNPDQGVAYDLLALESPVRESRYWRLSLLLGKDAGGLALVTDVWTETTRAGSTTISLGGCALTDDVAGSGWRPGAIVLLRVRKEAVK